MRAAVYVAHHEGVAGWDTNFTFLDLDVPFFRRGVLDGVLETGGEVWGAGFAEAAEEGGGKAPVERGAVDGCGDVEARADFSLGGAVGGLR